MPIPAEQSASAARVAARRSSPDEEDPSSELNTLRRELRRAQAELRDAGMRAALQQEEVAALRDDLRDAESARDEALARESAMSARLDAERARVNATMAAAENLVSVLRAMEDDPLGELPPLSNPVVTFQDPADMPAPAASPKTPAKPVKPVLKAASKPPAVNITPAKNSAKIASQASTSPLPPLPPKSIKQDLTPISEEKELTDAQSIPETPAAQGPVPEQLAPEVPQQELPQPEMQIPAPATTHRLPQLGGPGGLQSMRNAQQPHTRRTWSLDIPRTARTSPNSRPQSSRLLQSAFSGSLHAPPVAAVQRAAAAAAAGSCLSPGVAELPTSSVVGAARLPSRIESLTTDAHSGEIFAAAASVDGTLLATGGDDRVIRVMSLRAPGPPVVIAEPLKSVTALEWVPDVAAPATTTTPTPLLCAGTSDGAVRVFRRQTRRRVRWSLELVLPVHTHAVRRLLYRGDEEPAHLLSASNDRTLRLTDVHAGKRLTVVTAPSAALDVAVVPGAAEVVSAHRDGALRVWCLRERPSTGAALEGARVHSRAAIALAPLDDGRAIVSLGRDNALRVSDVRMSLRVVRDLDSGVETVSDWHRVTTDGRTVFCGLGGNNGLGIWNADTGKLVRRVPAAVPRASPRDVIELVAKTFYNSPSPILFPLWTNGGQFICAHRSRQLSFWAL